MGRAASGEAGTRDRIVPAIRPAVVGDADAVATLLEALGYPCTRAEAAERITVVVHDPRQTLLVADAEGEPCALIAMHTLYSVAHGTDLTRITALVVSPHCQRQGIGRRLLREAESLARRIGAARIEVTSGAQRVEAHRFYRDCGYADGSSRFLKRIGEA